MSSKFQFEKRTAYSVCHAPQIVSEMLPEVHIMEKCYFLNPRIHPQIMEFSVINGLRF